MLVLAFLLFAAAVPAAADGTGDAQRAADVQNALERFHERDSTFKGSLGKLVGYAIFPEVAKGGFIVGGAGVAIFILPTSGLMAEASIGGQKLKFTALKECL